MPMSANDYEVSLLHENPGELIIHYQEMIKIIVQKQLINPGFFKSQNRDDIIQTVNEHLLIKTPYIAEHYNGLSLLRTYVSVIIINKCREYYRSQLKQETTYVSDQDILLAPEIKRKVYKRKFQMTTVHEGLHSTSSWETEKQLVFEYEFKRFDSILRTYTKQKAKIELCIKYFFQIPCLNTDIKAYWPQATNKYLKLLSHKVDGKMTKTERYKNLTDLINKCEGRTNTNGAIRKWLADRMKELIYLLNGDPQQNYFDKETFQFFVEAYYNRKENIE